MVPSRAAAFALLAVLAAACGSAASETETGGTADAVVLSAEPEQRTAARLEAIRNDPAALREFTRRMPKGGDLHHHLSGAVYAESYLAWAADEGGFCIGASQTLTKSCSDSTRAVPAPEDPFHAELVGAWSMEGFVPSRSSSGHDHFFSTFGKYAAMSGARYHGKSLADVMERADSENEQYIELMLFSNSVGRTAGETV